MTGPLDAGVPGAGPPGAGPPKTGPPNTGPPNTGPLRIVFLGLSITSSWGNGHATNYRGLTAALARRGHDVLFLERDKPWYAAARDLTSLDGVRIALYESLDDLTRNNAADLAAADLVVVGSFVPQGIAVLETVLEMSGGVTAFYDIDTPVTMAALDEGRCEYLTSSLAGSVDLYLSFTAGPLLDELRSRYGVRRAEAFYCFVDPRLYRPVATERRFDLGYLGTYSEDRQAALEELLVEVARRRPQLRMALAGSMFPDELDWPANVTMLGHLPPADHPAFFSSQRFTLNVTRHDMRLAGWSPSVRLFEAAACATPVISDPLGRSRHAVRPRRGDPRRLRHRRRARPPRQRR